VFVEIFVFKTKNKKLKKRTRGSPKPFWFGGGGLPIMVCLEHFSQGVYPEGHFSDGISPELVFGKKRQLGMVNPEVESERKIHRRKHGWHNWNAYTGGQRLKLLTLVLLLDNVS